MNTNPLEEFRRQLRPAVAGLVLAVLTIFYGQVLGMVFGANEAAIKDRLAASAGGVRDSVYKGDEAAMKAVLDKSWVYMQRAHLHAGALGPTALVLVLLLPFLGASALWSRGVSLALGAGGLGYSVYWMWAGFRAPGMGGTGAARETLDWLAIPSSGLFVLGTLAVLFLLVRAAFKRRA